MNDEDNQETNKGSAFGKILTAAGNIKKVSFIASPLGLAIIGIVALLLLSFLLPMLQQGPLFPPFSPLISDEPTEPGEPGYVSPDIKDCQFTRSDQIPKNASYQSNKLLSYFEESSRISGVPAMVLAAIVRIESPDAASLTDSNINSAYCPKSITGALGLMQLQPPGTRGYYEDGINLGANFLGTTVDKLTDSDFCDPRKNIIIGAGFIIKKMKVLLGESGNDWNPLWLTDQKYINTLAEGYYGCLEYGGANPLKCEGPYSYGDDLWQSLSQCRLSTSNSQANLPSKELDRVVYWGQQINNALELGIPPTSFNKMLKNISNGSYVATMRTAEDRGAGPTGIYWCTNLVIDAYNLANIKGLNLNHQLVRNMLEFWKSTFGYVFIPNNGTESLQLVKPGYAVFRINPGSYNLDHASLVAEISVDDRGDGSLKTLDSNSVKSWSSTIINGEITDRTFISPITGFGGYNQ